MSKQIDGHKPGRYELVPVGELIPYVNNARTHSDEQIAKLQSSIREFGFVNPVLIDGNKNIIAGHGRLMAAQAEGMASVPCVFVEHLTETQKRAYILADNRLAELAGWDMDILASELSALDIEKFEIDLTGFNQDDFGSYQSAEYKETAEHPKSIIMIAFDKGDAAFDDVVEMCEEKGYEYEVSNY